MRLITGKAMFARFAGMSRYMATRDAILPCCKLLRIVVSYFSVTAYAYCLFWCMNLVKVGH